MESLQHLIATYPLIDNHAHNLLKPSHAAVHPLESITSEAHGAALTSTSHTLSHLRAVCQLSALLNCAPNWDAIKAARARLDPDDWARRCFEGVKCVLFDDGLDGDTVMAYREHDVLTGAKNKRVLRIEVVAEECARRVWEEVERGLGEEVDRGEVEVVVAETQTETNEIIAEGESKGDEPVDEPPAEDSAAKETEEKMDEPPTDEPAVANSDEPTAPETADSTTLQTDEPVPATKSDGPAVPEVDGAAAPEVAEPTAEEPAPSKSDESDAANLDEASTTEGDEASAPEAAEPTTLEADEPFVPKSDEPASLEAYDAAAPAADESAAPKVAESADPKAEEPVPSKLEESDSQEPEEPAVAKVEETAASASAETATVTVNAITSGEPATLEAEEPTATSSEPAASEADEGIVQKIVSELPKERDENITEAAVAGTTDSPTAHHAFSVVELQNRFACDRRTLWRLFSTSFVSRITAAISDPEVVGFKSIICYRTGLNIGGPYSTITTYMDGGKTVAKERTFEALEGEHLDIELLEWMKEIIAAADGDRGKKIRLQRRPLNDWVVLKTCELIAGKGKPLQFHTGLGDSDINLIKSNPAHLQPFIASHPTVPIVLLHSSYPYTREAGYLASVYPHVYLDFGEVFPMLSKDGQKSVIKQMLELTPINKLLWSSDGHWFPETFVLASIQVREVLGQFLIKRVKRQEISLDQAEDIVKSLFFDNSNRLYGLGLEPGWVSKIKPPPAASDV